MCLAQVKTLAMLLVNLMRPTASSSPSSSHSPVIDVPPDETAIRAAVAAAAAGDASGDGDDDQTCLLAHVPAFVWGATVESNFTSDARCRHKSKCIVDPLALRFVSPHYVALTPEWNWGGRANASVYVPWHHDNYECVPASEGGNYHVRSDVHRLNSVSLLEEAACQRRMRAQQLRQQSRSANGSGSSRSSSIITSSTPNGSASSASSADADSNKGVPFASAVPGMMTACKACYFGEPAVDFTVANLYGAELVRRVQCAHAELLGLGGRAGGTAAVGGGAGAGVGIACSGASAVHAEEEGGGRP